MVKNPIAVDLRNFTHKIVPNKKKEELEKLKEKEKNDKDTLDNS